MVNRGFSLFKDRKGVSPLIATVLLMAFAVALGAIVMTWGKNYVTEATATIEKSDNKLACSFDVGAEVLKTPGKPAACYIPSPTNQVTFLVQNRGQQDITKFKITFIDGTNGISPVESQIPLNKAEVKKYDINPGSGVTISDIRQIIINPIITVEGQEIACVDAIAPVTDIGAC